MNTRTLTILSLFVVALSPTGDSAEAQSAARPEVRVGDRWHFAVYYTVPSTKPDRAWVIESITASGIDATENGEPLRLTHDLNVLDSPRHSESKAERLRFPLSVGMQWRYTSDWLFKSKGSRGSAVVDVTVVGHEKIRVPAGEFDAFKLVATAALTGISGINSQIAGETRTTYWYAPAARAIVKSVHYNPYLGPSTVELVELDLQR